MFVSVFASAFLARLASGCSSTFSSFTRRRRVLTSHSQWSQILSLRRVRKGTEARHLDDLFGRTSCVRVPPPPRLSQDALDGHNSSRSKSINYLVGASIWRVSCALALSTPPFSSIMMQFTSTVIRFSEMCDALVGAAGAVSE